jgi:hypothetical protein
VVCWEISVISAAVSSYTPRGDRILQQVGGTLGIAILAVVLQHQSAGGRHAPCTAFGHTFAWSLALATLAVVPTLFLSRGKSSRRSR